MSGIEFDNAGLNNNERVINNPMSGTLNGVRVKIVVYPLTQERTLATFRASFELFRDRLNNCEFITKCLGCIEVEENKFVAMVFEDFRPANTTLTDFHYSGVTSTVTLIRDILTGVNFLHQGQFIHRALANNNSILMVQNGPVVSVKISGWDCFTLVSSEAANHSVGSNIDDVARLLSRFFCGNSPDNLPRTTFRNVLPSVLCSNGRLYAYVEEARSLVASIVKERSTNVLNHPFFWTSERRFQFMVDIYEYCDKRPLLSSRISNMMGISTNYIPWSLKDVMNIVGNNSARSPLTLLRSVRNYRCHGLPNVVVGFDCCTKFDLDPVKGTDLCLSSCVPSLLMNLYTLAKTAGTNVVPIVPGHSLWKYTSVSYHPM